MLRNTLLFCLTALIILQFLLINSMFKIQAMLERSETRMFVGLLACMKTYQQHICK